MCHRAWSQQLLEHPFLLHRGLGPEEAPNGGDSPGLQGCLEAPTGAGAEVGLGLIVCRRGRVCVPRKELQEVMSRLHSNRSYEKEVVQIF